MRFEYKVVSLKRSLWSSKLEAVDSAFQEQLNTLGTQGWRMVSAVPYGHVVQVYLMREK